LTASSRFGRLASTSVSRAASPRRRADAGRNLEAILAAAITVLNDNASASVDEVAKAAGLTRQTVYAHYPSREALVAAVVQRATDEAVAALDAAGLEELPPVEALTRLLRLSARMLTEYPLLVHLPPETPSDQERSHQPIAEPLLRLIRRGQRDGAFDQEQPAEWLLSALLALGHAAGDAVRDGRMSADASAALLERSVLAMFGVA
jgi:AcrR family transcriptional regulator